MSRRNLRGVFLAVPALQTFRLEGVTPERRPPAGPSSLAACPKGSPEPPLRGRGRLRRPRGASTFCRKKWSLWFPPGLPRVLPARVTRAPSPREQRRASPLRFQFPAPDLLRVREFQRLQHALLSETRLPGLGSHRKGVLSHCREACLLGVSASPLSRVGGSQDPVRGANTAPHPPRVAPLSCSGPGSHPAHRGQQSSPPSAEGAQAPLARLGRGPGSPELCKTGGLLWT